MTTGLGDTLAGLMAAQDKATRKEEDAKPKRKRKKFPSEEQRKRLTVDIDMEERVADVLRYLSDNPPESYNGGESEPIRPGDLATAAMIAGLVLFSKGELQVVAEWTVNSHGLRRLDLVQDLEQDWDTLVGSVV